MISCLNVYLVGGAVRDTLMGQPVHDRDFVVIGGNVQHMLDLGFRQVGADFPVFLHPETGEEYAFARQRRGVISNAFVCLEDDLSRRDLTINAMAQGDDGQVIDPFGGRADLQNKMLRHVGAQSFAEDPLRVFRVARFAARFPDFSIHPETLALMRSLAPALVALPPERVRAELDKGLMTQRPSRMFEVLRQAGAMDYWLPELARLWGIPQPVEHHPEGCVWAHVMQVVDAAARHGASLMGRWCALLHDLGKGVTPPEKWPSHHKHEELGIPLVKTVGARLKLSSATQVAAETAASAHQMIHWSTRLRVGTVVNLLVLSGMAKHPDRLNAVLEACAADARGRNNPDDPYPDADWWRAVTDVILQVKGGPIAARVSDVSKIPELLHAERCMAVSAWLKQSQN